MNDLPAVVTRLLRGAFLFFPILWALFWMGTPLGFWGAMYLALLLELLPALAVAQLPLVDEEVPLPRVPVYLSSAITILAVGGMALLVGKGEIGFEAMGLRSGPWLGMAAWTAGLSVGALLLLLGFLWLRRAKGLRETPLLEQLLPRTPVEKVVFFFLSLSAGLGEELAYRGFLIPALAGVLGGVWPAAVLSSVVFGFLHAYQGWLGVVRTGCLGLMLAASFVVTGTLWPAILAHALLDVMAGLVFGETLVKE